MAETRNLLEPAGELKFGQVGIANLRIKRLDSAGIAQELADKVHSAPQLFLRAPVVLDLSHLSSLPEQSVVRELIERIRACGMLPVGLSYGTSENEALAVSLDLPLFAKFRTAFERSGEPAVAAPAASSAPEQPVVAPAAAKREPMRSLHQDKPVRSGQQVYARDGDLIVTNLVANGAEVIADGSIHVYGPLRGRALAGAQGDSTARIYCQEFHAELVSIAGQYRVFEDLPSDLRGQPVQAWLEGEKLHLARLG
ncbi:MAG: septum site-determining protein MinC [Dokdonella sp.]|jgi:septum site-determining protein MinC|nr:septum site-determining protein MinC [Dokdonella sp.]HQX32888.1 septum site-determining protein MinC [Dokdonella sp.]